MKAIAVETKSDLAEVARYATVADRLLFDARAPRTATRPGGLGRPFDWSLLRQVDPGVPFMLSGGLRCRPTSAKRCGSPSAPGVDVSSGVERAPGEKDADKIRAFVRAAREAAARLAAKPVASPRMTVQTTQFVSHRARRSRALRHLWRPLCRRDTDAADFGTGAGLREGEGRSCVPDGDGRLSGALCRPPVAALFRRAANRLLQTDGLRRFGRRRQDLSEARGAQSHRRAQGQQRARPDPAGAAHGQEAHHRRDRRRHARRRHCNACARASDSIASFTWARSTSSGRSRMSFACTCSAPRSCRCSPAQRRSRTR